MNEFCLMYDNRGHECDGCKYRPETGEEQYGVYSNFTWTKECVNTCKRNNSKYINSEYGGMRRNHDRPRTETRA